MTLTLSGEVRTNAGSSGGGGVSHDGRFGSVSSFTVEGRGANPLGRDLPGEARDPRRGTRKEVLKPKDREREAATEAIGIQLKSLFDLMIEKRLNSGQTEAEFNQELVDLNKRTLLRLFSFCVTDKDREGRQQRGFHVDEEQFSKLMSDPRAIIDAYHVLRMELTDKAMGDGVKFEFDRRRPRPGRIDTRSITYTEGAAGNEAVRRILDFFGKQTIGRDTEGRGTGTFGVDRRGTATLIIGGVTVVLGSAAVLASGPAAWVLGGFAALTPLYAAGTQAFRPGMTLQFEVSADALRMAQTRSRWLIDMHGIDPNDQEIVTPGWVGRNILRRRERVRRNDDDDYRSLTSLDKEKRHDKLLQLVNAVDQFQYAVLDIEAKHREPMDIIWLLRGETAPPLHGDQLQTRILRECAARSGGPFPSGTPVADVLLYREVQEELLGEHLEDVLEDINHGRGETDRAAEQIAARRQLLNNGPEAEARKRTLDGQKDRVTTDRTVITDERGNLTAFTTGIEGAQRQIDTGREQVREVTESVLSPIPAGSTVEAELRRALTTGGITIQIRVSPGSVPITITDLFTREQTLITTKSAALATALAGIPAASLTESLVQATQDRIDKAYAAQQAVIDGEKTKINELIIKLEAGEKSVRDGERYLLSITDERGDVNARGKAVDTMADMTRALDWVTDMPVPVYGGPPPQPPGWGWEYILRNEDAAALRARLIAAGVPEDQMDEPDTRRRLTLAMGEARAQEGIRRPLVRMPDVTAAPPAGFGIADLLADPRTDNQIATDMDALVTGGTVTGTTALSEAQVRELRRNLRITADFEFVANAANSGLTLFDVVALTPQEITNRFARFRDVTAPTAGTPPGAGISEADLIGTAINDADTLLNIRNAYIALGIPVGTPPNTVTPAEVANLREFLRRRVRTPMDEVREEARRRMRERERAFTQLETATTARLDGITAERTALDSGVPTPELDVIAIITSSQNYRRIFDGIGERPLERIRARDGEVNADSIDVMLAQGVVTDADTQAAVPGDQRFLREEIGMPRWYARLLRELVPPPDGGIPASFSYRGSDGVVRRGMDGWIRRSREMITQEMLFEAMQTRWDFQVRQAGVDRAAATPEEAILALRARMELPTIAIVAPPTTPPAPPPPPDVTFVPDQPLISRMDLATLMSDGIFRRMKARIPTADQFR